MAGIGNIIQQGIKYTTKGNCLVRKQLGLLTQDFAQEGLKGIKIPKNAVSYDAVKVGKNFNADKCFTDIFTFRDKDGNILQRLTNEINDKNTKQTVKWYKELFEHDIELDEYGEELLDVSSRKISGFERINGRISKVWNEVITKTCEEKPKVTIFKRSSNGDQEKHYLAQFEKGVKPKSIENTYNLYEILPVTGEKIKGCGKFTLADSKVSEESLKEIAKHPYIFPTMSKYNKFIYRMFGAINKDAGAILTPEIALYKRASKTAGFYREFEGFSGTIYINKFDARGNIRTRDDLTNTIAHEYGHHQWSEKARNFEIFEDDPDLNISKEEITLLKKYLKSMENYISADKDIKNYSEQFSERAARVEGREATRKFVDLNMEINKEFPYMHAEQFYDISKEGNESIYDFGILLDMFGETKKDLHNEKEVKTINLFAQKLKSREP